MMIFSIDTKTATIYNGLTIIKIYDLAPVEFLLQNQ